MEQLIVITPSALIKNFNYNAAKKNIVSYVGTRLVKDASDEMPGIIVKEILDEKDKQAIQNIVFPEGTNGAIFFIEINEDCEVFHTDYLSAKMLSM